MQITLKAARVNSGYSQIQAAQKIGVSPVTLSHWENAKSMPSVKHIHKIEETYKIKYDEIIFRYYLCFDRKFYKNSML